MGTGECLPEAPREGLSEGGLLRPKLKVDRRWGQSGHVHTCEGSEAMRCLGHMGTGKMSGPPAAPVGSGAR